MSSYGDDLNTKDIHSSGTIFWQNFSPPLSGEGGDIPTLAAVLEAGDDANEQPLVDVGKITMRANAGDASIDATISGCTGIVMDATTKNDINMNGQQMLNTRTVDFQDFSITKIQGDTVNNTVCENLDLTSATNVFPSRIDDDTLEDVLARGNNANSQNITGVNQITASVVDSTSLDNSGLLVSQVMSTRSLTVNATSVPGQTVGTINLNVGAGASRAEIDFTGYSLATEADTFIKGHNGTYKTVCTDLDLTSSTNLLPPESERFEWGLHYQGTTPISIVSDDENVKVWNDNIYALTAATTNPAHQRQIVYLQFNVTQYSWGTIFIGLQISDADGSNPQGLVSSCWMTKYQAKGVQTSDRQKPGLCSMRFFVNSSLLTDGNQHRIHPTVKTNFDNPGEIRIHVGPNLDTYNPNDNASLIGKVMIHGAPCPQTWRLAP